MTTDRVMLAVIIALGGLLAVKQCQLEDAIARGAETALRSDSAAAARDTSRQMELKGIGDSLQAFQRRSIQQLQLRDAMIARSSVRAWSSGAR